MTLYAHPLPASATNLPPLPQRTTEQAFIYYQKLSTH